MTETRRPAAPEEAASLAHDVRNCAAALGLHVGALEQSPDPAARRAAERIAAGLDRIAILCAGATRRAPAAEPKLSDLVAEAIDLAEAAAPGPLAFEAAVAPSAEETPGPVRAALFRIVFNLVHNAAAAAARCGGSLVRVECARAGGRLVVDVSDDGPGLPPEAAALLSGRPPRGVYAPRGLGLRIAVSLAEGLGGRLMLLRNGPEGATIRFVAPLAEETAPDPASAAAPQRQPIRASEPSISP